MSNSMPLQCCCQQLLNCFRTSRDWRSIWLSTSTLTGKNCSIPAGIHQVNILARCVSCIVLKVCKWPLIQKGSRCCNHGLVAELKPSSPSLGCRSLNLLDGEYEAAVHYQDQLAPRWGCVPVGIFAHCLKGEDRSRNWEEVPWPGFRTVHEESSL